MPTATPPRAWRASILHFLSDPGDADAAHSYQYFEDGLLMVENGRVSALGAAQELLPGLPANIPVEDHRGRLIVPGFVDIHTHFAQTDVIASPGRQLLDWLENYTFPEERKFEDAAYARNVADFYLKELLSHGTTSAMVFGTVHKASADAFFEAAQARSVRVVAGKVLMDRNCPEFLQDTADSGFRDTAELIERWNGNGRLHVAITPRFAITSSNRQLELAGELARSYPDAHIQSHLAENLDEVAWVRELFPERSSYFDVYDHYGLMRERAVYAHCIHLDDGERQHMGASGATAAFCPTSNLFLGSGLYPVHRSAAAGLHTGLATDTGGGTHMGMLQTMGAAYNVTQLLGHRLSPLRAFYLATLAGAEALGLERWIGNLAVGKEADFVILDPAATPLLERRSAAAGTLAERLFPLMIFGDDRAIFSTVVMGEVAHQRASTALPGTHTP